MARRIVGSEKTLNGEVFERIRADILAGRRKPGQRLKISDLREDHKVSLSVIREALTRLAEQGLVQAEPRVGFRVTRLSRADLVDLCETRRDIEGLALRYAVERGDVAWEASVVAAHYTLQRTPQFVDDDDTTMNEEWANVHRAFHQTLIGGSGRPRLGAIAASLWDASELYRRWSSSVQTQTDRDVPAEHDAILEAVMMRDAESAAKRLADHIIRTMDVLLREFSLVD